MRRKTRRIYDGTLRICFCFLVILSCMEAIAADDSTVSLPYPRCARSSLELAGLAPDSTVDPCVVHDIKPNGNSTTSTVITIVQVTPHVCSNHRDGAVTAVEFVNDDHDQQGFAVGFQEDQCVQFRYVSVVAGNSHQLGNDYGAQHEAVLERLLQDLKPQYIMGSCSFAASFEKELALQYKTILMAQVGPPSYYQDDNPYVFGIHINSDEYPMYTAQALHFHTVDTKNGPAGQPVSVIYRTQSEFFASTCRSVVKALDELGFTDLEEVVFDPLGDHNEDGVINQFDEALLIEVADQACPRGQRADNTPAIFMCTLTEQDVILERMRQNGCTPVLLWLTAATWGWATANKDVVPYMFGGGQWHPAFTIGDKFFDNGSQLLEYNLDKFGYQGTYDMVVSYSIPLLFVAHIREAYRIVDLPDPLSDFTDEEGYEALRRDLLGVTQETLFGRVTFDAQQRNAGREAVGTQWLPSGEADGSYTNTLVSPFKYAEAAAVVPAKSVVACPQGHYVNNARTLEPAILGNKCSPCPAGTFMAVANREHQCEVCPPGSHTIGLEGENKCYQHSENLLPGTLLAFGYVAFSVVCLLSLIFIVWLIRNRKHPVVQLAQIEFLAFICVGAIISSTSILMLTFQAGSEDDTSAATIACRTAPFLYTIGWVLEYGSLTAKTVRLHRIVNQSSMRRAEIRTKDVYWVIAVILSMDLFIVIVWTLVDPLEYERSEIGSHMSTNSNVLEMDSMGRCASSSFVQFVVPIACIHFLVMIFTNVMLFKVRNVGDRYQEQKYVALASIFVFEVVAIGLPVILAVGDNIAAVFVVLTGVVALNDIGILCFVFVPKMLLLRKGLDEGVGVGETILKETYKKALHREKSRRSFTDTSVGSKIDRSPIYTNQQPRRSTFSERGLDGMQVAFESELSKEFIPREHGCSKRDEEVAVSGEVEFLLQRVADLEEEVIRLSSVNINHTDESEEKSPIEGDLSDDDYL